jgi:hypothetical protein
MLWMGTLCCLMHRALLKSQVGASHTANLWCPSAWFAQKMLRRELPTPHQPTWDGPEDVRNFATFTKNDLPPPATEDYRETEPGWDAGF